MSFKSKAVEPNYMTWELDQEEHAIFPGCYESYVGFDILDIGLVDLNKEWSKVNGMTLQELLVAYKDSMVMEMVTAEKMKDHKVLTVHHDNTQHLS